MTETEDLTIESRHITRDLRATTSDRYAGEVMSRAAQFIERLVEQMAYLEIKADPQGYDAG